MNVKIIQNMFEEEIKNVKDETAGACEFSSITVWGILSQTNFPAPFAWSKKFVYVVEEYDGKFSVKAIKRNP